MEFQPRKDTVRFAGAINGSHIKTPLFFLVSGRIPIYDDSEKLVKENQVQQPGGPNRVDQETGKAKMVGLYRKGRLDRGHTGDKRQDQSMYRAPGGQ